MEFALGIDFLEAMFLEGLTLTPDKGKANHV